jgi:hypothetical protein
MLHILPPERYAAAAQENVAVDAPSIEDLRRNQIEPEEYEFVLGRRQMASLSFVALVLIAVFSGIAYLAGRAGAVRAKASAAENPQPVVAAVDHAAAQQPQVIQAGVALAKPSADVTNSPLFGEPIAGGIYIQTGAVDKGVATIMAEGFRAHGLPSIVAPGPSDKVFRVLLGPFPNSAAYQDAKVSLDQIGITAFAKVQK